MCGIAGILEFGRGRGSAPEALVGMTRVLAYHRDSQRFLFGSEIKGILAAGHVERTVDLAALHECLIVLELWHRLVLEGAPGAGILSPHGSRAPAPGGQRRGPVRGLRV
jgi:hypothetical protein